jgi:hypothetical protein
MRDPIFEFLQNPDEYRTMLRRAMRSNQMFVEIGTEVSKVPMPFEESNQAFIVASGAFVTVKIRILYDFLIFY